MFDLPTVIGTSFLLNLLISCFFLSIYFQKKQRCYLYFSFACAAFICAEIAASLRVIMEFPFITHYLADLFIIASPLFAIIGFKSINQRISKPYTVYLAGFGLCAITLLPLYNNTTGQLLTSTIIACLFLYSGLIVYKMNTTAAIQQKILGLCFITHSTLMFTQAGMLASLLFIHPETDFSQPLMIILINHLVLSTATAIIMPFVLFADLEAKLERLVNRDTLTNLLNRRGFFISGEKLKKALKTNHQSLSVLMIDIDHFKQVNDQYGHSTGDMAIKWISQHILNKLNTQDIAARIGGEEFAVILANQSLTEAKNTATHICDTVHNNTLSFKGNTLHLSVSVGVSSCKNHCCSIKTLLERADKRLYIAKSLGRDQVVSSGELLPSSVNALP